MPMHPDDSKAARVIERLEWERDEALAGQAVLHEHALLLEGRVGKLEVALRHSRVCAGDDRMWCDGCKEIDALLEPKADGGAP